MGFQETLESVVKSSGGGVGGLIMAMDGIVVESFVTEPAIDIQLFGAEVAAVLAQLRGRSAIHLSAGRVEAVDLWAGQFNAVIRFLSDEYFVAIAVRRGGQVARARHLLRCAMPDLVSQL